MGKPKKETLKAIPFKIQYFKIVYGWDWPKLGEGIVGALNVTGEDRVGHAVVACVRKQH